MTALLRRWKLDADDTAGEELFALVMRELQNVARRVLWRNSGFEQQVDPQELVSEAYLRLRDYGIDTANRKAFFALMARAMRNYLMDLARVRAADKRPPTRLRVLDSHVLVSAPAESDIGVHEFYESLDALSSFNQRQAQVIELRVLGFESHEIAAELEVSRATVTRDVAEARAFLAYRLGLSPSWIQP